MNQNAIRPMKRSWSQMQKRLFLVLAALTAISGCINHSYYQSPFSGNLQTYHTKPLQSDSIRSAIYSSGSFTAGAANEKWRDNQYYFTGSIHRSHNFGQFQAYYGVNGSLGKYQVDSVGGKPSQGLSEETINRQVGGKAFGGYGLTGGANWVIPFGNGSELRLPELSFSVQKEFGHYLSFRKELPDTAANTIFKGRVVSTFGLGMEFAFRLRGGMIGLKGMAGGALVNPSESYVGSESKNYGMGFFSGTVSVVHMRFTGFGQFNIGNSSAGFQMGVQYQVFPGKHRFANSTP